MFREWKQKVLLVDFILTENCPTHLLSAYRLVVEVHRVFFWGWRGALYGVSICSTTTYMYNFLSEDVTEVPYISHTSAAANPTWPGASYWRTGPGLSVPSPCKALSIICRLEAWWNNYQAIIHQWYISCVWGSRVSCMRTTALFSLSSEIISRPDS